MMGAIEDYKARNAEREARRAEKQKPSEKRRWWFNQPVPIDRFTGWLVAWTALLFLATVGNVIVINRTDDKIGRQLTIMKAQTRPWLKGEFKLVKLSKNENGALNAEIDVRFINFGNYPAQIVWVGGAVLPNPELYWQIRQKDICDNVVSAWGNILKESPTNIAFPNEPSPWQRQFTFTSLIELVAWQNRVLTNNGGKIPNPKPPWSFNVPLVFIGCITYSASDLFDIHQTGFMLDFAKGVSPAGGPLDATFDVSGDGPREYDVSGVSLIQGFRGAFGN